MIAIITKMLLVLFLAVALGSCGKSENKAAQEVVPPSTTTKQMDTVAAPDERVQAMETDQLEGVVGQTVGQPGTIEEQVIDAGEAMVKEKVDAITATAAEAISEEYKKTVDAAMDIGNGGFGISAPEGASTSEATEEEKKKKAAE